MFEKINLLRFVLMSEMWHFFWKSHPIQSKSQHVLVQDRKLPGIRKQGISCYPQYAPIIIKTWVLTVEGVLIVLLAFTWQGKQSFESWRGNHFTHWTFCLQQVMNSPLKRLLLQAMFRFFFCYAKSNLTPDCI